MTKKLFSVKVIFSNQPDVINMWTCYDKYSKNDAKILNRNKSTTAILNNNLSKRVFLGPRYFYRFTMTYYSNSMVMDGNKEVYQNV